MTKTSHIKKPALATADWLADLDVHNHFVELGEEFYSRVIPAPLDNVRLVDISPEAAAELDLDIDKNTGGLLDLLNGENLPASFDPIATLYAGHQFGSWVPQLG